ncbi:MBL fold metallo-hydrolase [Streptacidiphilus neutrinimicus]|uniref:MBL fold metallo-hydrolase n=1 Tax=Streptacidiphilus neutrinimicus TaxID=105420 RepID=UPI000A03EA92|nr:MBL fold metallo-hydrolase [Streptacidiphilus neutrinimicus]
MCLPLTGSGFRLPDQRRARIHCGNGLHTRIRSDPLGRRDDHAGRRLGRRGRPGRLAAARHRSCRLGTPPQPSDIRRGLGPGDRPPGAERPQLAAARRRPRTPRGHRCRQRQGPPGAAALRRPHHAYLDRLARAGVAPPDVDLVVNTHLHADHAGGMLARRARSADQLRPAGRHRGAALDTRRDPRLRRRPPGASPSRASPPER